ncbi:MAG: hypothetical protein U0575_14560 [Phycisphaerales bacterium]
MSCALACTTAAHAAVTVFAHSGASDPVDEGWMLSGPGPFTTVGPAVVGSPPIGVWRIDDPSNGGDSAAVYSRTLLPCHDMIASASGWSLRTCLRVVDAPGTESIWVGYNTLSRRYDMWFSCDAAGQTTVKLMTTYGACVIGGPTATTGDGLDCGTAGFHEFDLRFDAGAGSADLFIDGVEVVSNYLGHTIGLSQVPGIGWGAGSSCGNGSGEFHTVEFVIDADPSADFDGSGMVDGADLGVLLAAWGTAACAADLNLDGVVDGADLGLLLSAWG